jgi:CRISPR type III-B/RAMP module RAMP protein Cmr1
MTWTTLTMRVTTPMFNGGADPAGEAGLRPADEAGIRVASVRGIMRFWFRALAGTVAGPDLRLLAQLERRVFGDAGTASPVQARVPAQPAVTARTRPDFLDGEMGQWLTYLLGQGLTKYNRDSRKFELTRPYVGPGQEFDLKLRFTDETTGALALAALRLCCLYGGFGARVRRGFGGVQVAGVSGPLPGPWTEAALRGRGLADYAGLRSLAPATELAACRDILAGLVPTAVHDAGRTDAAQAFDGNWPGPPPYPVLSEAWSLVGMSGGEAFEKWQDALWHAGHQLRHFRAPADNKSPAARYQPKIETSEWLDVILGQGSHFTVGALGLPVVYKDGYTVNADHGQEKLRRASPLWLRAVGTGNNWRLLSFAFLGQFLPGPNAPAVHLWKHGTQSRALQVSDDDIRSLASLWITQLRADKSFEDTRRGT